MSSRFRGVAAVMTAVFLLSVAVQFNDPDPVLWISLYGLAAAISLAAALGRLSFPWCAGALLLFLGMTALWLPSLGDSRTEAFTSFRMRAAEDEAPREAGGLLLCTSWALYLTVRAWRKTTSQG